MVENLIDDRLILDAGDYLGLTAALGADRHTDVAYRDVGQGRERERKL